MNRPRSVLISLIRINTFKELDLQLVKRYQPAPNQYPNSLVKSNVLLKWWIKSSIPTKSKTTINTTRTYLITLAAMINIASNIGADSVPATLSFVCTFSRASRSCSDPRERCDNVSCSNREGWFPCLPIPHYRHYEQWDCKMHHSLLQLILAKNPLLDDLRLILGNGKSTTWYSSLSSISAFEKAIWDCIARSRERMAVNLRRVLQAILLSSLLETRVFDPRVM